MDLQKLGLKNTKGRSEILTILGKEETPVDVEHIQSHLTEKNIPLNQATVYRILDAFYQKGIIERLEFREGKFRYELSKEDHHHLICENCGKIEDVLDCGVGELEKEIMKKKKFVIKRHSLEFFGVCESCQS